jgi:formylglycine-generating enzyme required for sulfatase activity
MFLKTTYIILLLVWCNVTLAASGIEIVKTPSGSLVPFWMVPKSTKGGKVSKIKAFNVAPLEVMVYPVTRRQYINFLKNNSDWKKENISEIFADKTYLSSFDGKPDEGPITEVSWFSARAFCAFHKMRLPTLAEWEYLAAASEKLRDANKDEKFLRRILDWYGETKGDTLKPVGSIYKNMYGLWDMHGLIWEWVEDFNSAFVTGESREDVSFNKDMFCGAGSMSGANKEDYAAFMRFAFRSSLKGNSSVWNLGFRCVRSL